METYLNLMIFVNIAGGCLQILNEYNSFLPSLEWNKRNEVEIIDFKVYEDGLESERGKPQATFQCTKTLKSQESPRSSASNDFSYRL
jgi:hypothetical protein